MRGRLLNLLALLSGVLCAAVCVVWVRSLFICDSWSYFGAVGRTSRNSYLMDIRPRRVTLMLVHDSFPPQGRAAVVASGAGGNDGGDWFIQHTPYAGHADLAAAMRREATGLGFDYLHWRTATKWSGPNGYATGTTSNWKVGVPYWFAAVVFAVGPLFSARRRIRAGGRARSGRCPACGYDLRATPGRCPECGWTRGRT